MYYGESRLRSSCLYNKSFLEGGNQTPKIVGETATDSQGSCGVMMLGRARGHKEAKHRRSMRLLSPFPHHGSQEEPERELSGGGGRAPDDFKVLKFTAAKQSRKCKSYQWQQQKRN